MIRDTLATFTTAEKPPADVIEMIEGRQGAFIVHETHGTIGGFATFGPFRGGPGYAATVEHTVIVAPWCARRSVGRGLIASLEDIARLQNKRVMIAAISSANPSAVTFHAALEFEQTAHMPRVGYKAGQWLDLILMQKEL